MHLNGMGVTTIQYELEKAGRLTALGKERWFASYISKMLRNSFYCGIIAYHKEYTPDFLKQKKIKNYVDLEYEDEIVITYNFTDSPERLKVNKEQILQEEKQTKRAKHSFSFNSGSTILAGSPPIKKTGETCLFYWWKFSGGVRAQPQNEVCCKTESAVVHIRDSESFRMTPACGKRQTPLTL